MKLICAIVVLLFIVSYSGVESRKWHNRDWKKWSDINKLIRGEMSSKRAIGHYPNSFDFFSFGPRATVSPTWNSELISPKGDAIDIMNGKGFLLKPTIGTMGAVVDVTLPGEPLNICGVLLGSRPDVIANAKMDSLYISWRTHTGMGFRKLSDTNNGGMRFYPGFGTVNDRRVVFFDSVPAKFFQFKVLSSSGRSSSIRVTFIHSCYYPQTKYIASCGEMIENNTRMMKLPFGQPLSIKCPVDCVITRPCWGYKIYTSDSPICWTATQNFGRYAEGLYTMYKIPKCASFRDQLNPMLNNKVYCRKYTKPYEAYTFDRKYYDYAIKQYKKLIG